MPNRHGTRKVYGLIAADVTKVAFNHNGLAWGLTNDHARDVIQEKLTSIANATLKMPIFSGHHGLLECWLQIHIPSLIRYPPATTTRFSSFGIPNSNLDRKSRKALRIFEEITAIGSRPDDRENPAEKLVRRTSVTIPAGATFDLDEKFFGEFLKGGNDYGNVGEDVIAGLAFDGVNHEFTFFEFEMLAPKIPTSIRKQFAADPVKARLTLIREMYMQRYPYENGGNAGVISTEKGPEIQGET